MSKYLVILILCAASIVCPAQEQGTKDRQDSGTEPPQTIPATVCEIVKDGASFDGKYVSVHAYVIGGIGHGFAFADEHCSGGLSMEAPESVREHEDYLAFMRAVLDSGGGFTRGSKSRLTATFYGLLKYHPKEHRKWILNVERISEIEVKPNISRVPHFSPILREVGTVPPQAARIFIFRTEQSLTRTSPVSP